MRVGVNNDEVFRWLDDQGGVPRVAPLECQTLLVGASAFKLLGQTKPLEFEGQVYDVGTVRTSLYGDLLLVSAKNTGVVCLCYISEKLNDIFLVDRFEGNCSVSWSFACSKTTNSFAIYDKASGECHVFTVDDSLELQLTGELSLGEPGEVTILKATFLDNNSVSRPQLLLVISRLSLVSYVLIDYDANNMLEDCNYHELPYLSGDVIQDIIPLSRSKCLMYTINSFFLINADQIMSGDLNFLGYPKDS